jgi:DNA uptake protein ComE-like DNA-binding protein
MLIWKSVFGFVFLFLAVFITACSSGSENRQTSTANSSPNSNMSPATTSSAPKAKLNVNNASQADLMRTIPGLGSRMLHEFEEYRPYKSIQQFRREIGKYVDQNQLAEYEKYIFVPIDENQSDAATLQQIPGLDAAEAQELIAGRPYASRDAFLAKLAEKVSPEELAVGRTYLTQP